MKDTGNLTQSEPIRQEIIATINDLIEDSNLTSYRDKYEYLKYKLCQISIEQIIKEG